jgi:hypothetical protein
MNTDPFWSLFLDLDRELSGHQNKLDDAARSAGIEVLRTVAYSGQSPLEWHSGVCARLYAAGWKYGEQHSAERKTDPQLRPWIDLTDEQRDSARRTFAIARTARALLESLNP